MARTLKKKNKPNKRGGGKSKTLKKKSKRKQSGGIIPLIAGGITAISVAALSAFAGYKYMNMIKERSKIKILLSQVGDIEYLPKYSIIGMGLNKKNTKLIEHYLKCVSNSELIDILRSKPDLLKTVTIQNILTTLSSMDPNLVAIRKMLEGNNPNFKENLSIDTNLLEYNTSDKLLSELKLYLLASAKISKSSTTDYDEDMKLAKSRVNWVNIIYEGGANFDPLFDSAVEKILRERGSDIFINSEIKEMLSNMKDNYYLNECINRKMEECTRKPRGYLDYIRNNIKWDSSKKCLSCPQEECLIYIYDYYYSFLKQKDTISILNKLYILMLCEARICVLSKCIVLEALRQQSGDKSNVIRILNEIYERDKKEIKISAVIPEKYVDLTYDKQPTDELETEENLLLSDIGDITGSSPGEDITSEDILGGDIESEDIESENIDLDMEPKDLDMEPKDLDMEPKDLDMEPKDPDIDRETKGLEGLERDNPEKKIQIGGSISSPLIIETGKSPPSTELEGGVSRKSKKLDISGEDVLKPKDDLEPGSRLLAAGPGVETPVAEQGVETPAAGPGVEKPVAEQGVEKPVAEQGVEKPVAEQGVETPAAGPGVETPVAGPGVEKPVAEQGVETPAGGTGLETPAAGPGVETPAGGTGLETPAAGPGVETPAGEQGLGTPLDGPTLPPVSGVGLGKDKGSELGVSDDNKSPLDFGDKPNVEGTSTEGVLSGQEQPGQEQLGQEQANEEQTDDEEKTGQEKTEEKSLSNDLIPYLSTDLDIYLISLDDSQKNELIEIFKNMLGDTESGDITFKDALDPILDKTVMTEVITADTLKENMKSLFPLLNSVIVENSKYLDNPDLFQRFNLFYELYCHYPEILSFINPWTIGKFFFGLKEEKKDKKIFEYDIQSMVTKASGLNQSDLPVVKLLAICFLGSRKNMNSFVETKPNDKGCSLNKVNLSYFLENEILFEGLVQELLHIYKTKRNFELEKLLKELYESDKKHKILSYFTEDDGFMSKVSENKELYSLLSSNKITKDLVDKLPKKEKKKILTESGKISCDKETRKLINNINNEQEFSLVKHQALLLEFCSDAMKNLGKLMGD